MTDISVKEKIAAHKRKLLIELFNQCTQKQQDFFCRIFGCGPDKVPEDKVVAAALLCERTVQDNQEKVEKEDD